MLTRRRLLIGALATGAAGAARAAALPRKLAVQPPVVTILGDSITAGLGLPAADALPVQLQAALVRLGAREAVVRGAGVSGDTTADGLARLDFSVQPDTRLCVVELGANDYLQSVDPGETLRNLSAIVARLKARRIAVVLCAGEIPARSSGDYGRQFNAIFGEVARQAHVAVAAGLLSGLSGMRQGDGLHPDAAGVKVIAARLAPVVARALRTAA